MWAFSFLKAVFVRLSGVDTSRSGTGSQIISDARALYEPFAKSKTPERPLIIEVDQIGTSVVGSAEINFTNSKVVLQKALVNSPRLTPDALRLTICHKLGHIFGGAPRRYVPEMWPGPVADDGLSVMSGEGQADYYAANPAGSKRAL
jgi:hypothetical protein